RRHARRQAGHRGSNPPSSPKRGAANAERTLMYMPKSRGSSRATARSDCSWWVHCTPVTWRRYTESVGVHCGRARTAPKVVRTFRFAMRRGPKSPHYLVNASAVDLRQANEKEGVSVP